MKTQGFGPQTSVTSEKVHMTIHLVDGV